MTAQNDNMKSGPGDTRSVNEQADTLSRSEKMSVLGEMASGIIHDFNNLLGAIIGRIQLTQSKSELQEIRRDIAQIEKIALQGAETVKRLQSFSRRGEQHAFEPTDLRQVVDDALELTRHRWDTQSQRQGVVYDIDRRLCSNCLVDGIHSELVDVVANLIFNALDAMPQGGRLTFQTQSREGRCVLEVADDGCGMSPEDVDQVFYPFFTTKGSQGTGLGLAVAYGVVSRHSGDIRVESEVGRGTRFIIEMPKTERVHVQEGTEKVTSESSGLRVLLVDDDQTILDVMGEALGETGHTVTTRDNGAAAIVAMQQQPFDVVVTDLGMPGVNGWEVARAARKLPTPLPVVVISGWGSQLNDDKIAEAHVDDVLAKPFHLDQLRQAIARVVKEAANKVGA